MAKMLELCRRSDVSYWYFKHLSSLLFGCAAGIQTVRRGEVCVPRMILQEDKCNGAAF